VSTGDSTSTSGSTPSLNSSAAFTIGRGNQGDTTAYFDGLIDEVSIWSRVLTTAERNSLYNSGTATDYDTWGGGSPTAPDAFVAGDWTLTDLGTDGDVRIAITSLPANGGSAITDLEYELDDSGTWVSLGGAVTGNYDISGLTNGQSYNVQIRAVNANGNGADSDTKSVTPTGVPDAFVVGDWALNDPVTGGQLEVVISTLPDANGAAITALQYELNNSGAFVSLGGTTTGTYNITGLTNGVSYDVVIRSVNATGNGADSDTKTATPTVASVPTVTTQAVTDIAANTATGNGNVTADGGFTVTERGIAIDTSPAPTTADTTVTASGTTGAFTASLTGLTANTTYYVRAYAINSQGTAYGSEETFTTSTAPLYRLRRYNSSTSTWELID